MSRKVAVLKGGTSAEREVSLVSGAACAAALREAGFKVTEIDVTSDVGALLRALTKPRPDVVFNALHGRWGEDGCIQGFLELLRLPYTHSGVMASAIAMDKQMTKHLVAAHGVISPEGIIVRREDLLKGEPMERPYVIKPLREGSSVGVRIVSVGDNRPLFEGTDWAYGDDLLVERFIEGRELTVSVMGDRPLAVTEIRPRQGFYDYTAKYTDGKADHLVPAPIPESVTAAALDSARRAHDALGCRGVSRSDFRYDDTKVKNGEAGELYFLEVNTQPGMTPLSLVPEQAAHLGISFPQLCTWIVENAACDS